MRHGRPPPRFSRSVVSAWQVLREPELVDKAKVLHPHLTAALAQSAADLATYGLDACRGF